MRPRSRLLGFLLALCFALPASAQSNEVTKYLNSAITLYENLEYEKALKQLERARKKASSAEDDARVSMMEGVLFAEQGKEEKAMSAFKTAFGLNPDARLPVEVSPKVDKVASAARENVRKMLAPQLARQKAEEEAARAAEQKRLDEQRRAEEDRLAKEEAARNAANQPPPKPVEVEKKSSVPLRPIGFVALGVGVAAAVGGGVCLAMAKGKYDGLLSGTTPAGEAAAARDSGKTLNTLGVTFTSIAIAAVATGIVMVLLGGEGASGAPASSTSVSFYATPEGGGFAALLRW